MIILIVITLFAGVAFGMSGLESSLIQTLVENKDLIVSVLMFSVGISVGMHQGLLTKLRQYHLKALVIPIGIILGSLLGGIICSLVLDRSIAETTATACGMGWYSLSGITIEKFAGAYMGTIAFLSNLMRELFSFLLIPLIPKWFNNFSCIAIAGATSEDTTLPMMIRYTNEETVVLSVLNGMLCSSMVPILIPLCFGL